ncbi:type III restriction enzyme, res subunit [Knoellia subterranea KCTC 19937]|uniref:Type III restriction enzyme, res subunit n=1 Tax=Knoellia subterranea KCTC 19937 TaxID=1385521 RepID=A0A0A0JRB7_9MICO|nr:type III restriction enzyme, res subunit [Knoellia subterranea KCTC 19937]
MRYDLYDYQDTAKNVIVRALQQMTAAHDLDRTDTGAVVLSAPTGAGKTVIATAVIEASLDGDPTTPGIEDATFLWVTDDPSLNQQTLHKMMAASSNLSVDRLRTIENDFDQQTFDAGRVYFLNIQKLASTATLSKGKVDGRYFSLWDTIANTVKERPGGFVVVIDEAHRGMGTAKTTRDTIVSQIIGGAGTGRPAVPVVWGISATPKRFREQMDERGRTVKSHGVPIDQVRTSGLLKDQIVLGHTKGVDAAESTLVRHAVAKVRDYEARWDSYCDENDEPRVRPVLVVQVEDKPTPASLGEVVGTILDEWPGLTAANIVHVFGTHATAKAGSHDIKWCPPEDVQDRQDVRVVLCMTAITTGWDCPRAEVLVSMRVAKDEDLVTQIMGRMVRTPLARRVESDITLNAVHCILPKFNADAVDSIAAQFEAGDEGIAGGTEIITEEIPLSRNPIFRPRRPEPAPDQPAPETPDAMAADIAGESDGEAAAWFGPDRTTPPVVNGDSQTAPARPRSSGPMQEGDDLWEAATEAVEPEPEVSATDDENIFTVIEGLPTYTIPSRSPGSAISRAFRLATLLAYKHDGSNAIDAAARKKVLHRLLGEIDALRADLDAEGRLEERLAAVANTNLYERAVTYGSPTILADVEQRSTLALDDRGLRILMGRARRALPEGLVDEYVKSKVPADDDVTDVMVLAIALSQDPELPGRVEAAASNLVSDWLQKHHSAITRLPEAAREDFDRVRRQSDRPEPTTLTIPPRANGDRRGLEWDRHLLADEHGKYRADLKQGEQHVLQTELDHGAIAWYRNPANRPRNAVVIPWHKWDGWHGMHPDFVFVHRVGGKLRASLIDPHGAFMQDAVGKLKGLAEYVEKHPDVYHRVQVVDAVSGRYRMLDLLDDDVREAIVAYKGADSDDAAELFNRHGRDY